MELTLLVMVALLFGVAAVRGIHTQHQGQDQEGKPQLAYSRPKVAPRSVWLKHW